MIDIHNHILYGLDDGSRTLEESVHVIKKLSEVGYTDIILTSPPSYANIIVILVSFLITVQVVATKSLSFNKTKSTF